MFEKVVYGITAVCALLGGGYMFFEGESIGWIIAGFVGGAFAPWAVLGLIVGLIQGLFEKSEEYPVDNPSNRRLAWLQWASGKNN